MSSKGKKKNEREKRKIDRRTVIIRVVACILAGLMLISVLYTLIYFVFAGDSGVSASEANGLDDISIAVGILYGTSVDVAYTVTTTNGFTVGSEEMGKYVKTFSELWNIDDTSKVTVLGEYNYGYSSSKYYLSDTSAVVGAYHIGISNVYSSASATETAVAAINALLSAAGRSDIYAIPSYVNGKYTVRIGSYTTSDAALLDVSALKAVLTGYTLNVVSPTTTGVTLVNHTSNEILFEYDCGTDSYLALDAVDGDDGTEAYLLAHTKYIYDGVFVFERYITSEVDGIEMINVVPLEDYVKGVLPYEISNSWALETQKAFAIAVRTYVLTNMSKYWSKYGFNVDPTSSSQVYRGVTRVNSRVIEAVEATAGMVLSYNSAIAEVYYCSSMGNCSAAVSCVWGSDASKYPWLCGVETPWEDYLNHTYAFWTVEVSPSELSAYLISRGYTTLTSDIASVTIDETAGDGLTYIYKMTIKDTSGNTVVIESTSKVRSAFSKYVNSANFVIGKGSVDYTEYTTLVAPGQNVSGSDGWGVITSIGTFFSSLFGDETYVQTAGGVYSVSSAESVTVLTADSTYTLDPGSVSDSTIVTKTATATDSSNFIIVGKGYGHGVGVSQYGLYDLATLGVSYDDMLYAYCPGTEIVQYKSVMSY